MDASDALRSSAMHGLTRLVKHQQRPSTFLIQKSWVLFVPNRAHSKAVTLFSAAIPRRLRQCLLEMNPRRSGGNVCWRLLNPDTKLYDLPYLTFLRKTLINL